jgi:hypothetical protein
MQIFSLALTIVGAVTGLIGGLANSAALVIVGTVLAIIGAICQYVAGRPFIKNFSERDWLSSGKEYLLSTPASRHRKGRGASATIYQRVNGSYETVICDEVENSDGSFTLRASNPFDGRLVLK